MVIEFKKIHDIDLNINRYIEKVSKNLTLVNVNFQYEKYILDSRIIHCRYDFGDFPPLDISFDVETGLLKEITFFIKKDCNSDKEEMEKFDVDYLKGVPSFEFNNVSKNQYYYDEVCAVNVSCVESGLVIYILGRKIEKRIILDKCFEILLDDKNTFMGFIINGLIAEELGS